jgi:hypothetical protein
MIQEARDRLADRQGDVPAQRGVRLIDTILHFDSPPPHMMMSKSAVSPLDVLAKFISMNNPASDTASSTTEEFFLMDDDTPLNFQSGDFDEWYLEAFGV